jgi:hypothetical protein
MISATMLDCNVLTGPMSGCLLASYVDATGVSWALHIGTTDDRAESDTVKAAWRGHATGITSQIAGFDPTTMSGLERQEHSAGAEFPGGLEIWGLITATGDLFALRVYRQMNDNTRCRIARAEQIPSLSDDAIRAWQGRVAPSDARRSGFVRSLFCCFRS